MINRKSIGKVGWLPWKSTRDPVVARHSGGSRSQWPLRSTNDYEMTLGIVIYVDVVHPVFPCAIDMAVSRAQCGLELTVRVLLVK